MPTILMKIDPFSAAIVPAITLKHDDSDQELEIPARNMVSD